LVMVLKLDDSKGPPRTQPLPKLLWQKLTRDLFALADLILNFV